MKNKGISTPSTGNDTEGIGALAQYQLFALGYAVATNAPFKFKPFESLQHYQHCGVTQEEFCEDTNNLFKFMKEFSAPNEDDLELTPKFLMSFGQGNLPLIQESLKPYNLHIEENQKYFSNSDINVALHLRTYTNTDCCTASVREYLTADNSALLTEYYSNVMNKIKEVYYNENIVLHVYGQGTEKSHKFLEEVHGNIQYHIDEYPPITLYHMTNADILLMANSSFSYVPHLFNKTFSIAKKTFHHTLHNNNTARTNHTGDFDINLLKQYKNEKTN